MSQAPAPEDRPACQQPGEPTDAQRAGLLLSLWQVRADLYADLETHTRRALSRNNALDADDIEDFIEQQITTEQTEYIAQFLFVLRCAGCAEPGPLGAYIDRHNAMVDRLVVDLETKPPGKDAGDRKPLGARLKQRLWRLRSARFNERMKAGSLERLGQGRLVLSLKDFERFMAMHMDPTLCRDRLDALIKAGLLLDEVRPNLRLIWSEGLIEALVARHLDGMANRFLELAHAPA